MVFELLREPLSSGYGDALISLAECKQQLSIESSDTEWDTLIPILRDASIGFIEDLCETRLGPAEDLEWRSDEFPSTETLAIHLGVYPVTSITAISWVDSSGDAVTGDLADFRLVRRSQLLPSVGGDGWPSDAGGEISITFDAGYAAGDAPVALLHAVRLNLGHLFNHREAVAAGDAPVEVPLGVMSLCSRYRQPRV